MLSSLHRRFTTSAKRTVDISGRSSRVTAVLGAQWGDEGKGKLADVLAENYDLVARFNGGANAGHTVIVNDKKFAFHLLPCGLVYPHTVNLLGAGTVVSVPGLLSELSPLDADDDVADWRGRLFIDERAHILFDFHQKIDGAQEAQRGDKNIGTTKKGIGPCYAQKCTRNGIRFGALKNFSKFADDLRDLVSTMQGLYGFEYDVEDEIERFAEYQKTLLPMLVDGPAFVNDFYAQGKNIITEGANAAMLDTDFGTYPFVTSSTTTAGGVCTGLGIAPSKVECVIGVVKAYTTRVGWGPFPTELTDPDCGGMVPRGAPGTEIGKHLQLVGAEYGVTTGRKRRCGWLDIPLLHYSNMINGYTSINMTKLDVLDELEEVKIATKYLVPRFSSDPDSELIELAPGRMPSTLEELEQVQVQYETLPGWKTSIANCKTFSDLPNEAQTYVRRVEELLGVPVSWIGVGAGRNDMVQNFSSNVSSAESVA
eukprot:g3934.t1